MRYRAVLFDLLTALLDSWTVWDRAAGSQAAGRAWRAAYLKITYGCGAYRPYETLVAEAAQATGLERSHAARLESLWGEIEPWPDVAPTLRVLRKNHRLGVVTNCSERLGRAAAARVGVPFDVVITSERAGAYKPELRPYALALEELGLPAREVLFVAGSAFDLFGTAKAGMDTYWHNRVGLATPEGAPAPLVHARDLSGLLPLANSSTQSLCN